MGYDNRNSNNTFTPTNYKPRWWSIPSNFHYELSAYHQAIEYVYLIGIANYLLSVRL